MSPIVEEVLFDRMICAEASDADWDRLEGLAARDPAAWRRLAYALKDHGSLVQAVSRAGDRAERIALPIRKPARWTRASGWVAAAAVAALWAGTAYLLPPPPPAAPLAELDCSRPGEPCRPKPAEPVAEVVQELPSVLVSTRELPQGVEVTYVRRTVERRTARGLFEETTDEWGEPAMVPATIPPTFQQEL